MSINTTSHHLPTAPSPLMQRHVLQRVEETLLRRFEGTVTAETVPLGRPRGRRRPQACACITFLPALAEREATRRLQAATPAHEAMAVAARSPHTDAMTRRPASRGAVAGGSSRLPGRFRSGNGGCQNAFVRETA